MELPLLSESSDPLELLLDLVVVVTSRGDPQGDPGSLGTMVEFSKKVSLTLFVLTILSLWLGNAESGTRVDWQKPQ